MPLIVAQHCSGDPVPTEDAASAVKSANIGASEPLRNIDKKNSSEPENCI